MKLMLKINKNNTTLLQYITKVDEKKINRYRLKWALWWTSWFVSLIKSPKVYLSFLFLYFLGRIK